MENSPDPNLHENESSQEHASGETVRPRQRFWQRLGGDGFLISLGLHIIVGIIAGGIIIQQYAEPKKEAEDFTTGAGGGSGGANAKMFEQRIKPKNPRNLVKSQNKLAVKGGKATVALPDMPQMQSSALESGALAGGASKGIGGGGGGGDGTGLGPGKGGGRNMVSMFGMKSFGEVAPPNSLEGTLYDLKKNKDGKERIENTVEKRVGEMKSALQGIARNRFDKNYLESKYFKAPQKLYAPKIFIPSMDAPEATKAFECEKEIQAPGWLAYYEAWITPPETGEYRFAGMGDDAMIVALDQKLILWAYWNESGRDKWFKVERDWEPKGNLKNMGTGGRYFGSWVKMEKGKTYKIQIIFAESTGGRFSAELQIQKKNPGSKAAEEIGKDDPLPIFTLAPMSDEETKSKSPSPLATTAESPSFGCEANNVKPPRVTGVRR